MGNWNTLQMLQILALSIVQHLANASDADSALDLFVILATIGGCMGTLTRGLDLQHGVSH